MESLDHILGKWNESRVGWLERVAVAQYREERQTQQPQRKG